MSTRADDQGRTERPDTEGSWTDDEALTGDLVLDPADVAEMGEADTTLALGREGDGTLVHGRDDDRALATVPRMDRFMAQIRQYALLSEAEERALARRARDQQDAGAARQLVLHNLRLVVKIAYEFRRAWSNVMDLVQEGSVGLVEAVRRWDPERGARLGTYAAYWIRAYVLQYVLNNVRLVGVGSTRAGRKLFFQLERERQKLRAAGIEPTPARIAHDLGVDVADVAEVAGHLDAPELPWDAPVGGARGTGRTLGEEVRGSTDDPERTAAGHEASDGLQRVTREFGNTLTDPREAAIWQEHLLADEPVSLAELGARFGVSKQRMGQVVVGLKKRFREALVARYGEGVQLGWLVS